MNGTKNLKLENLVLETVGMFFVPGSLFRLVRNLNRENQMTKKKYYSLYCIMAAPELLRLAVYSAPLIMLAYKLIE